MLGQTIRRCRGFLLTETVVALALLAVLLGAFGYALSRHRAGMDRLLLRQQALAAAEAQLQRLRSGVPPLSDTEFTETFRRLRSSLQQEPGEGDWAGLTRCRVTVEGPSSSPRPVTVMLVGYIPTPDHRADMP